MTIAEQARNLAISLEAKKDALSQRQSGDWKVSFTVQGVDMNERLTLAPMGTRYAMVLVEIGDDELPVSKRSAKEDPTSAAPAPVDPRPSGGKRDWVELRPSTCAAIRGNEATFRAYLNEECGFSVQDREQAAIVVRQLCRVESRTELDSSPEAALRWKALDDQYLAWKALEHA